MWRWKATGPGSRPTRLSGGATIWTTATTRSRAIALETDMEHTDLPGQHELSMTVLMTPDMANFSGKVHGGGILKKLGGVAYACASRYSGHYVDRKSTRLNSSHVR